jgi:hypothetical protein
LKMSRDVFQINVLADQVIHEPISRRYTSTIIYPSFTPRSAWYVMAMVILNGVYPRGMDHAHRRLHNRRYGCCQIMWVHVGIRCGGGFRWELGIPRCTQTHTSLIVNQAYACATTHFTVAAEEYAITKLRHPPTHPLKVILWWVYVHYSNC